jgi:hypothetical protein
MFVYLKHRSQGKDAYSVNAAAQAGNVFELSLLASTVIDNESHFKAAYAGWLVNGQKAGTVGGLESGVAEEKGK